METKTKKHCRVLWHP